MARYVDVEKIFHNGVFYVNESNPLTSLDELINRIFTLPSEDVAPVVRGEWKINPDGWYPYCSNCGNEPKNGVMSDYCPDCGAYMKGETNAEN
jgi:hypothetical protein